MIGNVCHFRTLSLWEPSQLNEELDRGFAIQQSSSTGFGDVSPWGPRTAAQSVPPKGHFYTSDYNHQKGMLFTCPRGLNIYPCSRIFPLTCHTSKALDAPLRPMEPHDLPVTRGHVTQGWGPRHCDSLQAVAPAGGHVAFFCCSTLVSSSINGHWTCAIT